MTSPLQWGILSTGSITHAFATGLSQTDQGKPVAVASRDGEKADKFAAEYEIPHAYGSYEELLADPEVEAVYIATPHPMHAQWVKRAAESGKHVLTEKPAALNREQVESMVQAARHNGITFMEGFMYRCHPQTAKLVELVQGGEIGEVRVIQANFGFNGPDDPESRVMNNALGGGGILDVGCYTVSFSRLIAGVARGKPFADPEEIKGSGHVGATNVDEWAAATLKFPGDIIAQCTTSIQCMLENTATIYGSEGRICIPTPWTAGRRDPVPGKITLLREGEDKKTFDIPATRNAFGYEADRFAVAVASGNGEVEWPAMTWRDSTGNAATLDKWREEIGLVYEDEK